MEFLSRRQEVFQQETSPLMSQGPASPGTCPKTTTVSRFSVCSGTDHYVLLAPDTRVVQEVGDEL